MNQETEITEQLTVGKAQIRESRIREAEAWRLSSSDFPDLALSVARARMSSCRYHLQPDTPATF
jgi:hypothetical protein